MPPQGARPQGPGGIAALQAPNMAKMADGGIAGYPDEDEIGMAEGGVARYNGQEGSRVSQDVQVARDQEAFRMLLAELQKAQAQVAQGNARAQGDVESIQGELRRHIKRNPSFAQILTSALPMSAAQAAPVAQQSAPMPTPAGQIPTEAPGMQAPPAVPEGFFSRLGSQLGMSEETKRNVANLNTALGGALGPAYIPSYLPKAQSGIASLGERIYNTISPQKGVMTAEQITSAQKMADTLRTGESVESARRAGQTGGATLEETKGLMEMARQTQAADRAARAAQIPSAAEKVQAASLAREAQTAARIPQAARAGQTSAAVGSAAAAMGAANAPAATPMGSPRAMSDMDRARFMEANEMPVPVDPSTIPKEDRKGIIDAAKAATPPAERKGLTNDDYLIMGLTMMANPGRGRGLQGLMEAVGTGGIAARQSQLGREKSEREAAKEASEASYREALGEQARRGPSEIALIERIAKENNVPFTKAMEMVAGAKRDPQTEEALMKAWSSSAFLQMQYPNPQDYIKLMRASTGGASQSSAADQALVSKYLNPR